MKIKEKQEHKIILKCLYHKSKTKLISIKEKLILNYPSIHSEHSASKYEWKNHQAEMDEISYQEIR